MSSRRYFIKTLGLSGVGLMLPWKKLFAHSLTNQWDLGTNPITLFNDFMAVPHIPVAIPDSTSAGITHYTIQMAEGLWQFHSQLPANTKTWGYGGFGYLGPTIEARQNQLVGIKWVNNLPNSNTHFLGNDPKVRAISGMTGKPEGIASVHVHGSQTAEVYDGGPERWYPSGNSFEQWHPNSHDARMMWYHDHAMGSTRLNIYAGLAALWFIRDDYEDSLNLPGGDYEIPLVLQDKDFDSSGQLIYNDPWIPEFFGRFIMANGTCWPKLAVEPRKYRFRILNGGQARYFSLFLDNNIPMYQIGCEGGFLPSTVTYSGQANPLVLGIGERADVIIDFSGYAGQEIVLNNNAPIPYEGGVSPGGGLINNPSDQFGNKVMKFIVGNKLKTVNKNDTSAIPMTPKKTKYLLREDVVKERFITLNQFLDPDHGFDDPLAMPMHINGRPFMDSAPTENPRLGSVEIWNFINLSPDNHPMHMHLINFQVLERIPFNAAAYSAIFEDDQPNPGFDMNTLYTGAPVPPHPSELGWKETVKVYVGMITRVIVLFEGFSGNFVYHCHILDHEENDMMQYMTVLPAHDTGIAAAPTIPKSYVLHQNYPNPFNPSTTINFEVPKTANVEIKIFDGLGRHVNTIVNEQFDTGAHKVVWDGKTSFGFHAPSGVYLYTMKSNDFVETKKMLMLK